MPISTPDSTIPFSSFVDPFPLNTGSLNAFLLNVIPSYRYLASMMLTQSHALLQNMLLLIHYLLSGLKDMHAYASNHVDPSLFTLFYLCIFDFVRCIL